MHADAPPFFLFHGAMDKLVPFEHAEVLHEALLAHDVHSELYRMRLRGHVSAFVFRGGAMRRAVIFLHAMADRQGRG